MMCSERVRAEVDAWLERQFEPYWCCFLCDWSVSCGDQADRLQVYSRESLTLASMCRWFSVAFEASGAEVI